MADRPVFRVRACRCQHPQEAHLRGKTKCRRASCPCDGYSPPDPDGTIWTRRARGWAGGE